MHERTREADMIADNAINGVIDARTILGSSHTPLIFRKFFSNDIDPNSAETFEIASIRGAWAGSIVERPIDGANFAKLYQHHFVVKPNSLIAKDIRKLISGGMVFQVAELINRLTDVVQGQPDSIFAKYFFDKRPGQTLVFLLPLNSTYHVLRTTYSKNVSQTQTASFQE